MNHAETDAVFSTLQSFVRQTSLTDQARWCGDDQL